MPDYDFQILQPNEFECLTRDLLQKKEGIFVESFTQGCDDGIDLRFAKVAECRVIVQAKRYKSYATLKRVLSKEVSKVKTLRPDRYILSTSIGLTPGNKTEIMNLFAPYILRTEDIIGRDDLNNLLGQYPEIEKQYYKLWLGSTPILEDILNKRINNWSEIEIESIRREVATYVMNPSFKLALDILSKNRYVVISGIPGIGKTTLARMLVNYLLSEGYDEFVMLEKIGDAAQKLANGKKQIFYYDDFLGSTFFQNDEKGFDHKLLALIDKVKHEVDKVLILSTREYILAEAMQVYDAFSTNNIELAKCVLDLSNYTENIRANILYNHLAMADLPISYIRSILQDRSYMKIIRHGNFNPRIIQSFLNEKLYMNVAPEEFVSKFISFFERPYSVWKLAFVRLKPVAQYSLLIRMSMGEKPVFLSDWYSAVKNFVYGTEHELHLQIIDSVWKDTLKIIEGTFIRTQHCGNEFVVLYQNPSVYDFLMEWLRELPDTQELIIKNSLFVEQLYTPFSDSMYSRFWGCCPIKVDAHIFPSLENAYWEHLQSINSCNLRSEGIIFRRAPIGKLGYILNMYRSFGYFFKRTPSLLSKVATQDFLENITLDLGGRMSIFDKLSSEAKNELDMEHLTTSVLREVECVDDFVCAMGLISSTETGEAALKSDEFLKKVEDALDRELEAADSVEECSKISEDLSVLSNYIPSLSVSVWNSAIEEVMSSFPQDPDYDGDFVGDFYDSHKDVNSQYDEMFTSLLGSCQE